MKKDSMKNLLYEKGFLSVGVTTAEPFYDEEKIIHDRSREGLLQKRSFDKIKKRTHPQRSLKGARSIISVAAFYHRNERDFPQDRRLARFARVRDYHEVVKKRLESAVNMLKSEDATTKCRICVDTGPLVDRAAAHRAGVGFFGQNCSLIVPDRGSWVVLGAIITTAEFEPDKPLDATCKECKACLDACPTKALSSPYVTKEIWCLSYLTQKKGVLPLHCRPYLADTLWGCDLCQEACPHNQGLQHDLPSLWNDDKPLILPDIEGVVTMSQRQYHNLLGKSALYWRGRTVLQRNAVVMLGAQKDTGAAKTLIKAIQDERAVIRGHAAWSLGQLDTVASRQALTDRKNIEENPEALEEINRALEGDDSH